MNEECNESVCVCVCVCVRVCLGGCLRTHMILFIDAPIVLPLLIFRLVFLFDNIVLWNQFFAYAQTEAVSLISNHISVPC